MSFKHQEQVAQTRQKLLACATRLVAERGFDELIV